jgi:hypothetical protein
MEQVSLSTSNLNTIKAGWKKAQVFQQAIDAMLVQFCTARGLVNAVQPNDCAQERYEG